MKKVINYLNKINKNEAAVFIEPDYFWLHGVFYKKIRVFIIVNDIKKRFSYLYSDKNLLKLLKVIDVNDFKFCKIETF